MHTDAVKPGLLLLDQVKRIAARKFSFRLRLLVLNVHTPAIAVNLLLDVLGEFIEAIFLDEPHEPRLLSVLPPSLVPENSEDGLAYSYDGVPVCGDPNLCERVRLLMLMRYYVGCVCVLVSWCVCVLVCWCIRVLVCLCGTTTEAREMLMLRNVHCSPGCTDSATLLMLM